MEKRYNFRIYPNKAQEEQIQRNFNCARFVYNHYLAKRIKAYKNSQGLLGTNDCCRDLTVLKKTEGYTWLQKADDNSLRQSIRELDLAFKKFFKNAKNPDIPPGFPKFKSKKEKSKSYRSKNNLSRTSVVPSDSAIKLPKLGWVDCRVSRHVEGRILSATVFQVPSGKYFVSVCCTDYEPKPLPKTGAAVGIQMGEDALAETTDGKQYANPHYYENSLKKIARLQRQLSRKPSDSNNREKTRLKLARLHERIHNQRSDALNKTTTQIVRDYDQIYIHDVNLQELLQNPSLARQVSDAAWGEFVRQLTYKSEWYGKTLLRGSRGMHNA